MTSLFLPAKGVQYPITILSQYVPAAQGLNSPHQPRASNLKQQSDQVLRGTPLFAYTWTRLAAVESSEKGKEREAEQIKETRVFESPIEGQLQAWLVSEGTVIDSPSRAIVKIEEPCTHPVQLGGLCAICGKDLTAMHYTGFSDTDRATISMSHHHASLTVSQSEAERLEAQTTERLQKDRKLSLIVDLDQTIIQATVDPTVGDWTADPSNPNHEALSDVVKFQLAHDGTQIKSAPASGDDPSSSARADGQQQQGTWYYLKPRPGLPGFLEEANKKYEMHIYTMGTRSYAECVCEAIDPKGTYFGGRILTRDESGSLTQKSLNRLFPCDTSMVVIIDDRADVWGWSPNLLKVVPYDFFGIGDLNAAFLPKKTALDDKPPDRPNRKGKEPEQKSADDDNNSRDGSLPSEAVATAETAATITSQIADRPLAKQAAEAQSQDAQEKSDEPSSQATPQEEPQAAAAEPQDAPVAVLNNDDSELDRVMMLLEDVHAEYYRIFEAKLGHPADVKTIIPHMKGLVLAGVHLLFSSVIPLGVDQASSEIWKLAESFGATCHLELSSKVTHVVAGKEGTSKVLAAQKRKGVYVVWTQWLLESMAQWRRESEEDYLLSSSAQNRGRTEALSEGWPHPAGPSTSTGQEKPEDTIPSSTIDAEGEPDPSTTQQDEDAGPRDEDGEQEDLDFDWDNMDAEMDAYLQEAGEDGRPLSGVGTPRSKRSRSSTPSLPDTPVESPTIPQSPLRKRQKLAASRTSKLKEAINDTESGSNMPTPGSSSDDDDFLDSMAANMAANLAE